MNSSVEIIEDHLLDAHVVEQFAIPLERYKAIPSLSLSLFLVNRTQWYTMDFMKLSQVVSRWKKTGRDSIG